MTHFRISEAAELIGVSDDTVRRWVQTGVLSLNHDSAGVQVVDGAELAVHTKTMSIDPADVGQVRSSARNRFVGLVTKVTIDGLMAQVEVQSGPHRIVSLMSAEAARDLRLEVGSKGVAVVKATMVILETEKEASA